MYVFGDGHCAFWESHWALCFWGVPNALYNVALYTACPKAYSVFGILYIYNHTYSACGTLYYRTMEQCSYDSILPVISLYITSSSNMISYDSVLPHDGTVLVWLYVTSHMMHSYNQ